MKAVHSVSELYAHAIAIEREAAERYSELAERMDDEGREELARVFAELARMEAGHLETLERRAQEETSHVELLARLLESSCTATF
jgi:rubrerythrin